MKKYVNDLILRYPFAPLITFAGGSSFLFALTYSLSKPWALAAMGAGVTLLLCFVVFLFLCRSGDRVAIGTAGPAIAGPLLAHLYVKYRAPQLQSFLQNGGDTLIQLAFFFGALFGAAAYVFSMFGKVNAPHVSRKCQLSFIIFILVLGMGMLFDFTSQQGRPGPDILLFSFHIEAPRLTSLTLGRMILALLSIVSATWPERQQMIVPLPEPIRQQSN